MVVVVKVKTVRPRTNRYPQVRISPRQLSEGQRDLVIQHYLLGSVPAWNVARMLGPEWGQSDIYFLAKRLAAEHGITRLNRLRHQVRLDWLLIKELRDEGASWDEVAEFFGSKSAQIVKEGYAIRKRRGDFHA